MADGGLCRTSRPRRCQHAADVCAMSGGAGGRDTDDAGTGTGTRLVAAACAPVADADRSDRSSRGGVGRRGNRPPAVTSTQHRWRCQPRLQAPNPPAGAPSADARARPRAVAEAARQACRRFRGIQERACEAIPPRRSAVGRTAERRSVARQEVAAEPRRRQGPTRWRSRRTPSFSRCAPAPAPLQHSGAPSSTATSRRRPGRCPAASAASRAGIRRRRPTREGRRARLPIARNVSRSGDGCPRRPPRFSRRTRASAHLSGPRLSSDRPTAVQRGSPSRPVPRSSHRRRIAPRRTSAGSLVTTARC